jgi:hypothetical protein
MPAGPAPTIRTVVLDGKDIAERWLRICRQEHVGLNIYEIGQNIYAENLA